MSTLTVLAVGVCLAFSLRAGDMAPQGLAADWSSRRTAAMAALRQRDYTGAAQLLSESLALAQGSDERRDSLALYGIALYRSGRNAEAAAALERALAEWNPAAGQPEAALSPAALEADRLSAAGVLAAVDRGLGDYGKAERVLRGAIETGLGAPGPRALLMVSLADLLREEARENEAASVLDGASRLAGLSRAQQTGVMVETAELDRDLRRWDAAIALWNQILRAAEADQSPRLEAVAAGGLGETWYVAGNLARAEPLLRRSLDLMRKDPEASPPQIATALSLMARLHIDENKLALAAEDLDEALSRDEDSLGPEHPQVAMLLELRADILSRRGEAPEARESLEQARSIMAGHFGPESAAMAGVFAALGDVEERDNHPAAAVGDYRHAMDLLGSGLEGARFGPGLLSRYAAALKAAHRGDEARDLLKSAAGQSFREK